MILVRGISLLQRIWNKVLICLFGAKGTIYVFHEINETNANNTISSCFCSTKSFESFVIDNKDRIVPFDVLLACDSKRNIVITFDDVPTSVYKNAYPLLNKEKIPFTIFVSTKFVGKEGFLSIEQLKEMSLNPLCTVGAHTKNHTRLRLEDDSYGDMFDSKNELEQLLGKAVDIIAYPYGRADAVSLKNRREAKEIGYKAAVCTIPTPVPRYFDKWYIPRVFIVK